MMKEGGATNMDEPEGEGRRKKKGDQGRECGSVCGRPAHQEGAHPAAQDLVYQFTDNGQPAHYYNIGDGTSLARRQYGGAIGIMLVITFVAGIPPCVLRLPVALLCLAC